MIADITCEQLRRHAQEAKADIATHVRSQRPRLHMVATSFFFVRLQQICAYGEVPISEAVEAAALQAAMDCLAAVLDLLDCRDGMLDEAASEQAAELAGGATYRGMPICEYGGYSRN